MKKVISFILLLLFAISTWAADLTAEQKRFQTSIKQFLSEEGFMPFIDDDGDLSFKKEGVLYWITIGDGGPFYIEMHRSGYKYDQSDKRLILEACNYANRKTKSAKAIMGDTYVSFVIEVFCHSSEEFKYVFYKNIKSIETSYTETMDYYKSNGGMASTSSSAQGAIGVFFPIEGVTLGSTTWKQAENLGFNVKQFEGDVDRYFDLPGGSTVWDHEGAGVFTSIYTVNYETMPEKWVNLGMSWSMSYNDWMTFFKNKGFTVKVTKQPVTEVYSSRNTLAAKFTATSSDKTLSFDMSFNYGNENREGYSVSSKNTLYSMTIHALK